MACDGDPSLFRSLLSDLGLGAGIEFVDLAPFRFAFDLDPGPAHGCFRERYLCFSIDELGFYWWAESKRIHALFSTTTDVDIEVVS